jgi:hypothetical protein
MCLMVADDSIGEAGPPLRTFARDVRRSLRCWSSDPRLPLVGLAFGALESVWIVVEAATGAHWVSLVGTLVLIFFCGFYGVERVWYVQLDRGSVPRAESLWRLTGQLRWRYIRLGLFTGTLLVLPMAAVFAATGGSGVALWTFSVVTGVILDVVLTFATVTLAFYDSTAGNAVRHSLIVIRQQWPTCAWYVFVPALTLRLIALLPRGSVAAAVVYFVASLGVAMLVLIVKGATVLFYSDRYPTLDDPLPSQARTE